MAVWLVASAACGRIGYTTIDPEIADGAGGSGMTGGGGQGGSSASTGGVGGGTGGSGTGGSTAMGGSGATGGAGATGGSGTGGGGAGGMGGSPLGGSGMAGAGGTGTAGTGGTGGTPGTGGSGTAGTGGSTTPGTDAAVDLAPDLPPDSAPAGSITLTGNSATALRGTPGTGALENIAACPGDQVVIGFEGFQARSQVYPWLASAAGVCGIVSINGSTVTIAEAGKLPLVGGTSGVAWTRRCPQDQVMIGFDGTSAGWVGVLKFRCAPLVVAGTGAITTGSVTTLPDVGAPSGSAFPTTDCAAGQVAHGQHLSASMWMDGFSLLCATPQRR
jgi:hypothetical protein